MIKTESKIKVSCPFELDWNWFYKITQKLESGLLITCLFSRFFLQFLLQIKIILNVYHKDSKRNLIMLLTYFNSWMVWTLIISNWRFSWRQKPSWERWNSIQFLSFGSKIIHFRFSMILIINQINIQPPSFD
jgi:hypothetical protein